MLGTIAGSAPGFLLPFAVAHHFGVGRISDAYFFAFALATFVSVVYEGVLLANATPVLQADKLGGAAYLRRTLRRVLMQAAGAAVLTYVLVGGVGGVLSVSGRANWTPEERHTTIVLLVLLTPYVIASTVTAVLASGLYALEDFFSPLASMALRSLVPLGGLLFIDRGTHSIEIFATLMCIGELTRGGILGYRLRSKAKRLDVGQPRKTLSIWKTGIPHAASMTIAVANPVIDRFFAAPLGTGSVTVLELGERILYTPLTALTSFFVLVAGVRWTEQSFAGGAGLRKDFRDTMLKAVALGAMAAGLVVVLLLVIEHLSGATFVGAPTSRLVPVALLLILGLPGGLIISLGARFLTATRHTRILPAFAVLGLVVNVSGDYVGSRLLGLDGIALASSAMRYGNALLYIIICSRLLRTIAHAGSVTSAPATLTSP